MTTIKTRSTCLACNGSQEVIGRATGFPVPCPVCKVPTTIEPGTYDVPGGICYGRFTLDVYRAVTFTRIDGDFAYFRPDAEWLTWAASELAAGRFVKVEE